MFFVLVVRVVALHPVVRGVQGLRDAPDVPVDTLQDGYRSVRRGFRARFGVSRTPISKALRVPARSVSALASAPFPTAVSTRPASTRSARTGHDSRRRPGTWNSPDGTSRTACRTLVRTPDTATYEGNAHGTEPAEGRGDRARAGESLQVGGESLRRHGIDGQRVAVYLVVDYSGSMRPYYNSGAVQALADRVLGLSAHLDDDGRVPVFFFSTDVDAETEIRLDDHTGRIGRIVAGLGHMGKTSYHLAMDAVIDHYVDSGSTAPALVVFQTDGGPINKLAAERYVCKAARLPLFWQFIGFGDPGSRQFDFLRRLDELDVPAKRPVDNAGFFHAGRTRTGSRTASCTTGSSPSSRRGSPPPGPGASSGVRPGAGPGREPGARGDGPGTWGRGGSPEAGPAGGEPG